MPETILFTDVGEGIHEGKLVQWLITEGQSIKEDQPVCEIETDKAVVEITSSKTGTVLKLHAKVGAILHVGDPLVTVGKPGESYSENGGQTSIRQTTSPDQSAGPSILPTRPTGESQTKNTAPSIAPNNAPAATKSIAINPSSQNVHPTLTRIQALPAARMLAAELGIRLTEVQGSGPGGLITEKDVKRTAQGTVQEDAKVPAIHLMQIIEQTTPSLVQPTYQRILAPPSVRKLAFEYGVDLATLKGTGPAGRITGQDVQNAANTSNQRGEVPARATIPDSPVPSVHVVSKQAGPEIRIPISVVRKKIAERMTASCRIPHVTHVDEADVTDLWRLREEEKSKAADKGVKLTLLAFVAKAVVKALIEFPTLNASLDEGTQESVLKKYYHLGIAVDTQEGLMVPVVKNADRLSVFDIAKEIQRLSEEARHRVIKLDELSGSTFTITNIGSSGGLYATPLINPPEAAILGVMRMQVRPVFDKEGNVRPRNFLPLCLTFDHRLNDGAKAAEFVNEIKKHLENPQSLLTGDN